jgi:transcriptional regulator with XRE-family HTH domain
MKTKESQAPVPLNKALRLLREYHGLKQVETATRLGFQKSVVSELESGTRPASLDVLNRYAETFKMPMSSVILLAELQDNSQMQPSAIRRLVAEKALKILDWLNERTKIHGDE